MSLASGVEPCSKSKSNMPSPTLAPSRRPRGSERASRPARRDADHYFNAPDRDFAVTDEAVRVRSIGEKNFVTYKGPKIDRDDEDATGDRSPVSRWRGCGRRLPPVAHPSPLSTCGRGQKDATSRGVHPRQGSKCKSTLDEVDGVGRYAELEIVAPEDKADAAKAAVLAAAAELGLAQSERRSYLQLLLEKQG